MTRDTGEPWGAAAQGASRAVDQLLAPRRIGTVMNPDQQRPEEAEGVLNPASARSRDGDLYLFPRVVAKGNHSRIAIAAVRFDAAGDPADVRRVGMALEPQEEYELGRDGLGGVEDPRITYVPLLDFYVMSYTALGPDGARIALAVSKDLYAWTRLGLLYFEPEVGVDFNPCNNKDCVIFPIPVRDPEGRPTLALLHRPLYQLTDGDGPLLPPGVTDPRPSIWISYAPLDRVLKNMQELTHVFNHRLLAHPLGNWENHHIGSGAPPLLTEEGWLLYYHGVLGASPAADREGTGTMVYQTGVVLLDGADPRRVLFRSSRPVLVPQLFNERHGVVPNVVFPTAVDIRGRRIDVYYGAADQRIAAATTEIASPVLLAPSVPALGEPSRHFATPAKEAAGPTREVATARDLPATGFEAEDKVPRGGRHDEEGATAMQVKDIMTSTVEVVSPNATLEVASERMRALDIGMLPVRDGGELVGVITDRDMAVRAMSQGLDPKSATVGDVMTPEVVSCFDDQSIEDAAGKMVTYRIRRLVVINRANRLVGIVSLDDIAAGSDTMALVGETLVRTSKRSDRTHGYRRILVALDGSKFAERVLPCVEPLAQKFGATVTLLQAVTPAPTPEITEMSAGVVIKGDLRSPEGGSVISSATTDETRARGRLSGKRAERSRGSGPYRRI